MVHLCTINGYICIGSKGHLKVFSVETGTCVFSHQHVFDQSAMDGCNNPLDQGLEDLCTSPSGKYICAVYSDKTLKIIDAASWTVKKQIKTRRRPTAMTFEPKGEELLVADKSGDLYKYVMEVEINSEKELKDSEDEEKEEIQPILGHVSMLLDVKVAGGGKYILTADRDEKIRVSEFDHPFVVQTYCLGHSDFVCNIEPVPSKHRVLFLSTSGDGTIRLWDANSGIEYACHEFQPPTQDDVVSGLKSRVVPSLLTCAPGGDFFAVASNQKDQNSLSLFKINDEKPSFSHCSDYNFPIGVRITDLLFKPDSSGNLYVMVISNNGKKADLLEMRCQDGMCCVMEDELVLKTAVEAELRDFPMDLKDHWSAMFKARCEGEAYSSYLKKKEERLVGKRSSKSRNGTRAKRLKVDQPS